MNTTWEFIKRNFLTLITIILFALLLIGLAIGI